MDAAILVEEAPEFTFRNGMFYVTLPGRATRAMRPHTYLAAVAAAVEAARELPRKNIAALHAATGKSSK